MKPIEPTPVKFFCGILYSDAEKLQQAFALMQQKYGPVEWTSPAFVFDMTDYYDPEMGDSIQRLFYSFENLVNPKNLAQIKIDCNEIEDLLAVDGLRKVNLDPGYMDYDKVVLASAKYAGHKIYLDFGIYADTTMMYRKGDYYPSEWCFPDFKSGDYKELFLHIRAQYKGQLRKLKK
jgi:hypothetical protein